MVNKLQIRNHTILVYYIIAILLSGSCMHKQEVRNPQLNEKELIFNEKLSTISKEGDTYYVGTESAGRVYLYSPKLNQVTDTLLVDCGRVYKIRSCSTSGDTLLLGTQNLGLKKVVRRGDSLAIIRNFFISGMDNRYSAYDLYGDGKYVMTSHGIFSIGKSDTLEKVYTFFENGQPEPFVAANYVKTEKFIFVATAKGLVRIDNDGRIEELLKGRHINYVETRYEENDSIVFALTDNVLYSIDSNGDPTPSDSFSLPTVKKHFFSNGVHYFLAENYVILASDDDLQKHKEQRFKRIILQKSLPVNCHHLMADSKEYAILISSNAIFQIGHHLVDVFGDVDKGGVQLSFANDNAVFYLVNKTVYKQNLGDSVANEILTLPEKNGIRFINVSEDGSTIYYVNNHNEVFRTNVSQPWWQFWSGEEKIGEVTKDITTVCYDSYNSSLIIGIRDGLLRIGKEGTDTIRLYRDTTERICCETPYISRFATNVITNEYLVPTMNDGIYLGRGEKSYLIPQTDKEKFIRDVAFSGKKDKPYYMTNRMIYNVCSDSTLSNDNHSSRLLAASPRLFFFPDEVSGVRMICLDAVGKLVQDTTLFADISFIGESSIALNKTAYLGGDFGALSITEKDGKIESRKVTFKEKKMLNSSLIIAIVSLFVLIGFVIFWYYDRYRYSQHVLRNYRKTLLKHVILLISTTEYIDDNEQMKICQLQEKISKLDLSKNKKSQLALREFSVDIRKCTARISSHLTKELAKQINLIKQTNLQETSSYLAQSDKCPNTLEDHLKQLQINSLWLKHARYVHLKLEEYEKLFMDSQFLPEVVNGLTEILKSDDYDDRKLGRIDVFFHSLHDSGAAALLKEHLNKNIECANAILEKSKEMPEITRIIDNLVDIYKSCSDDLDKQIDETISNIVIKVSISDRRLEEVILLLDIFVKVAEYRKVYDEYQTLSHKLETGTAYGLLMPMEKERRKNTDRQLKKDLLLQYKEIANHVNDCIDKFYSALRNSTDQLLIDALGMPQKKGHGQFMWESILALLLSGTEYSDKYFSSILDYNETRIRDTRSKLLRRIKSNIRLFEDFAKENPSSISILILKCSEQ